MRVFLILSITALSLFGVTKEGVRELIKKGQFEKACQDGQYIVKDSMDGKFLVEYGKACMEADMIDALSLPSQKLRGSKESREAAALFATLQAQKKLLYLAVNDGISLVGLKMPKINHPLSVAFEALSSGAFTKEGNKFLFKTNVAEYELFLVKDDRLSKVVLFDKKSGIKRVYY